MIVARIIGGLGNQLFQYATARALADAAGEPLYLDCRGFTSYRLRNLELAKFNIRAEVADEAVLRRFPEWQLKLHRRLPWRGRRMGRWFSEKHLGFYPQLLQQRGDLYLDGYFQWEDYFAADADALRADLVLRNGISPAAHETLRQIRATPSVAIHVRRGDYVSNPVNQRIYGSCSGGYYREAFRLVKERAGAVTTFVFSDDVDYARSLFADVGPAVFIGGDGRDPVEDMHLMSACNHHIIANSSFSWWGAWLGKRPGQVVVAPVPWFDAPDFSGIDLRAEGRIYVAKYAGAGAQERAE